MDANLKKIYDTIKKSKEPLKQGDVAEKTGIDKAEVTKAINALKKEGKITSPKRCYYSAS